jgi:diguanylate cyclase (GGDEF)-like protein/PAS domain S-box-containing protein
MNLEMLGLIVNNAALLLSLSIVHIATDLIKPQKRRLKIIMTGIISSAVCVVLMSVPYLAQNGLTYDTKTILISITAFVFGGVPTLMTITAACVYRIIIGGGGVVLGIITICSSALIGLIWRRWLYPKNRVLLYVNIYFMGITVQVVKFILQLAIMKSAGLEIMQQIILPTMVFYPLISVLLGMMLIRQQERRRFEEELKASEEKYSSYIENGPQAVFVIDENGKYIEVNRKATEMTGYSKEELLKMNMTEIKEGDSVQVARDQLELLKKQGKSKTILRNRLKEGEVRWWSVEGVRLSDDRFLIYSTDITDRKKAEEELIYLLYHDSLTNLYNRKYYEEVKARMDVSDCLPLSVLMADINGVRLINEAYGYQEGDKMIAETAKILQACSRSEDILARIGGDEFALLLPRTNDYEAVSLMDKIYAACKKYNQKNKKSHFEISLSIGYDTKEKPYEEFAEKEKGADEYLRRQKLLNGKSVYNNLITSMMSTVYEKSQETEEHAKRLVAMTRKIGRKLNLSQKNLGELELFCLLHDIGKVVIDDRILKKDTALTNEEWKQMKRHPEVGYKIASSSPELASVANFILSHHERWDGSGYPRRLMGEEIPMLSRILAVVDAYDAMVNDRFYRKALSKEDAMQEIINNAGTQFDPQIVDIFKEIMDEDRQVCKIAKSRQI